MYAIIESCGRQYKVAEGDVVFFEKLEAEEGKKVKRKLNTNRQKKKIIVFKMKAKKNERKKQGHRQPYTKVEITSIKLATANKAETKTTDAKKETVKKETKATATANA